MRSKRAMAKDRAAEKMHEASYWWAARDNAEQRARIWGLLYELRLRRYEDILQEYDRGSGITAIECEEMAKLVDAAAVMQATEHKNMDACAEAALGCKIAAQIYWEEYEQREWKTLQGETDG